MSGTLESEEHSPGEREPSGSALPLPETGFPLIPPVRLPVAFNPSDFPILILTNAALPLQPNPLNHFLLIKNEGDYSPNGTHCSQSLQPLLQLQYHNNKI